MAPAALPAGLNFAAPEFQLQPANSCGTFTASATVANRRCAGGAASQGALGQPFCSLGSSLPTTPRSLLQPSRDYIVCFTPSDCSSATSGDRAGTSSMADGASPLHLLQHGSEQLLAAGPGPSTAVGAGWAKPKCSEALLVASDMEPIRIVQEVMTSCPCFSNPARRPAGADVHVVQLTFYTIPMTDCVCTSKQIIQKQVVLLKFSSQLVAVRALSYCARHAWLQAAAIDETIYVSTMAVAQCAAASNHDPPEQRTALNTVGSSTRWPASKLVAGASLWIGMYACMRRGGAEASPQCVGLH